MSNEKNPATHIPAPSVPEAPARPQPPQRGRDAGMKRNRIRNRGPCFPVQRTHDEMHRVLGDAIGELRRFYDWSQAQLAREISRNAKRGTAAPSEDTVSKWEHASRAPDSHYRIALARIAEKDEETANLGPIFLAGIDGWNLVSRVRWLHERRHKASAEGEAPREG